MALISRGYTRNRRRDSYRIRAAWCECCAGRAEDGSLPNFVRTLAWELAEYDIRANCVSPGIIRTSFQDYLTPQQVQNNIDCRIPLHREGKTEDAAGVIAMLAASDYNAGENFVIDGGQTMRIA